MEQLKYGKYNKILFFAAVCITFMLITYLQAFFILPGRVILLEDDEYIYSFKTPFYVNYIADREDIVQIENNRSEETGFMYSEPVSVTARKKGTVNLSLKMFGLIPVKTTTVDVLPNNKLVACGNTIGVNLKINGILVIGMADVLLKDGKRVAPAKDSGIKVGDFIIGVDDKAVNRIEELIEAIDASKGREIVIKYRRGEHIGECRVEPALSNEDKKYHIGLWVRDSTAGIGTLTFYNPRTMEFGALGHGITDIDTGTLMPVDEGEILDANILAIKKGKPGIPGELKGIFSSDRSKLGVINKNNECGIFGVLNANYARNMSEKLYSIGLKAQVKEGPAKILANIDGKKVEEYDIEIQKVSRQALSNSKGMVIKITDPELLNKTGGIVQGMSGSPIIQDDKIIGAVTHVLVNDPTRGYGIFIENMLKNIRDFSSDELINAG